MEKTLKMIQSVSSSCTKIDAADVMVSVDKIDLHNRIYGKYIAQ